MMGWHRKPRTVLMRDLVHPNDVVAFLGIVVPPETVYLPRLTPSLADPAVESKAPPSNHPFEHCWPRQDALKMSPALLAVAMLQFLGAQSRACVQAANTCRVRVCKILRELMVVCVQSYSPALV